MGTDTRMPLAVLYVVDLCARVSMRWHTRMERDWERIDCTLSRIGRLAVYPSGLFDDPAIAADSTDGGRGQHEGSASTHLCRQLRPFSEDADILIAAIVRGYGWVP